MSENGNTAERRYMTLGELATVCARAELGEYGEHSELILRLAFELGVMHAAVHEALSAAVMTGGGGER